MIAANNVSSGVSCVPPPCGRTLDGGISGSAISHSPSGTIQLHVPRPIHSPTSTSPRRTRSKQVERRAPDEPTQLPGRSWRAVLKGTVKEFKDDELADRAAALTYYGVLSLFPALLVLVSLLGIAGQSARSRCWTTSRNSPPDRPATLSAMP